MLQLSRLRLLADYHGATRNEIAVDEMFLAMAHMEPDQVGYLPRVPRWAGRAIRMPWLTCMAWRLAWLVWLTGGAFAFFLLEYLKLTRLQRRENKSVPISGKVAGIAHGAVLGFSTRTSHIVNAVQFPSAPKVWVTMPWSIQQELPLDALARPLLTLVDRTDFNQAFLDSITATYSLARHTARSRWALQSYTAFRWFLVRRAVDRIAGPLVMTEHFDRWAVLLDRSVRAGRRTNAPGDDRRVVLIQHGTLGGLGHNTSVCGSLLQLPVRLGCVDELHAYNTTEEASFRTGVFTATTTRPLTVNYFSPNIKLSGDLSSPRLRILFVGHPLCEKFQVAVYHVLMEKTPFEAYYKPHPKAPMSGDMGRIGWTIIDNPQIFPRVDLVVSYPSTLVFEYEGKGVPASVHSISIGISTEELSDFLNQTQELIGLGTSTSGHSTGQCR